ncbi:MAG: sensor histidine kinase [Vicinamibacterales bacterium]
MHPILHHWPRLRLFLLLWLPIGTLLGTGPYLAAGGPAGDAWPVAVWGLAFATPALASWYLVRFTPPGSGAGTLLWRVGGGAVVSSALWTGAGWAWLQLWTPVAPAPDALFEAFAPTAAAAAACLFVAMGAIHYALVAADGRTDALRRVHTAEVGAREAELRALRAQVNPHFLFNCLHSISALAGQNPEAARRMCQELADFFRDSLRAGSEPLVPIETEVALVRRYLDIEQVRFGDRLRHTVHIAPEIAGLRVPPLILQPLIENAVRHGIATLLDGGEVTVDLATDGDRAVATIENPFDPDGRRPSTGIGLENVRARLTALYQQRASLTAGAAGDRYRVRVVLPREAA